MGIITNIPAGLFGGTGALATAFESGAFAAHPMAAAQLDLFSAGLEATGHESSPLHSLISAYNEAHVLGQEGARDLLGRHIADEIRRDSDALLSVLAVLPWGGQGARMFGEARRNLDPSAAAIVPNSGSAARGTMEVFADGAGAVITGEARIRDATEKYACKEGGRGDRTARTGGRPSAKPANGGKKTPEDIAREIEEMRATEERFSYPMEKGADPAQREEVFDGISDRLDELIDRSRREPNYRIGALLDAVFSLERNRAYSPLSYSEWIENLYSLLGIRYPADVITAISPDAFADFLGLVRRARARRYPTNVLLGLLARCKKPSDIEIVTGFVQKIADMDDKDVKRLLTYRRRFREQDDPRSSNFDDIPLAEINRVFAEYDAANEIPRVRERIAAIAAHEDSKALFRVALPILRMAIEAETGERISPQIEDALLGLERVAKIEPIPSLGNDLGNFTDEHDFFFDDSLAVYKAGIILEPVNKLSARILGYSSPMRDIIVARMAAEENMQSWRERCLYASMADDVSHLKKLAQDENAHVRIRAIERIVRYHGDCIAAGAIDEAAVYCLDYAATRFEDKGHEDSQSEAELNLPDGWELLEDILGFLDRIWTQLDEQTKGTLFLKAVEIIRHSVSMPDAMAKVLSFIAAHGQEMPQDMVRQFKSDERIVRKIADFVKSERWITESCVNFPFFIAGKNALRLELERWAWTTAEDDSADTNNLRNAMKTLGDIFTSRDNGWDKTLRHRALAIMTGLLGYQIQYKEIVARIIRGRAYWRLKEMLGFATEAETRHVLGWFAKNIEHTYPPGQTERTSSEVEREKSYMEAFAELSPSVGAWHIPAAIEIFSRLLGQDRLARMEGLAGKMPKKYFPALFKMLYQAHSNKEAILPFVLHLIDQAKGPGQFEQVVLFFRDFAGVSDKIQREFIEHIENESKKTAAGQGRGDSPRYLIGCDKARARFHHYIRERFVNSLGLARDEKARLRADLDTKGGRSRLWTQNDLLPHLTSLVSFSKSWGIDAVAGLVRDLISEESVAATARVGNQRFINPLRYKNIEGAFAPEFVKRWANDDKDTVIPIGELGVGKEDVNPREMRREIYKYYAVQMAHHLGMPHASNMPVAALFVALDDGIGKISGSGGEGIKEWASEMKRIFAKMAEGSEISEIELDILLSQAKDRPAIVTALGKDGAEFINDMRQLKKSLKAGAIKGRAWLVITSDPAVMIASGRDPVTCQDPTRDTGHNKDGQVVNRPRRGQYRYAMVVVAEEVKLADGIYVASPDAHVADRSQIEITTATGRPDAKAIPRLLVERHYPRPGFMDKAEFAAAINQYGTEVLGLPKDFIHIEFTGQNMRNVPPPIEDRNAPVYRDTFGRR